MRVAEINHYLMSKPETDLSFPFGEEVHVYKVKDKIFALVSHRHIEGRDAKQLMLNLKCDPNEARALCDIFDSIQPGYHANKKHWISIYIDPVTDCDVPDGEIERLIDSSFLLVVSGMSKSKQVSIQLKL